MFLIGTIKPIVEKNLKLLLFFTGLFRGGELRAYKIKPVLFLYAVGLEAAKKTLHKRKEKTIIIIIFKTVKTSNCHEINGNSMNLYNPFFLEIVYSLIQLLLLCLIAMNRFTCDNRF